MAQARANAPHILHLQPDGTPQAAARTAMLIAAFGRTYRHSIVACDPARRQWLSGTGSGSVTWLTGFPELAGGPTPGRLNRLARAMLPFDLVISHGYGAINAAMARTTFAEAYPVPPIIHHEWDHKPVITNMARRRRNWFRRFALGKTAALVVDSERMEERALVDWQQPIGRVKHIAQGIDVRAFAKRPRADALPMLVKRPGELWIGVVDEAGDLNTLPQALDLLTGLPDECQLVWATAENRAFPIAEAADARSLNHRVHNIAPMPPLERFIGLFDIFLSLSPDVSRDTVLAAMASGLPIVAPPIVPIAYPVSDENQPWVRGNPGESLRQLVNSARLGKESGEANRRRALAQFDIEKTAATYQRLFDSAIALRSAQ
jgi:glycosyltransferase involved in cell wall biosynthesis